MPLPFSRATAASLASVVEVFGVKPSLHHPGPGQHGFSSARTSWGTLRILRRSLETDFRVPGRAFPALHSWRIDCHPSHPFMFSRKYTINRVLREISGRAIPGFRSLDSKNPGQMTAGGLVLGI